MKIFNDMRDEALNCSNNSKCQFCFFFFLDGVPQSHVLYANSLAKRKPGTQFIAVQTETMPFLTNAMKNRWYIYKDSSKTNEDSLLPVSLSLPLYITFNDER